MVQQKRLFSVAITIAVAISASAGYCVSEAARLARPSPEQLLWQDHEIGMFIHFSMNTWQDQEGDDLSTPLSTFNPGKLDTDQWAQVAANMGAGFVVLVAKHVGGFCLWPTQTTDYSIKNTPWRGGKGDVVGDLAESCRKYGVRLGVYLSPADRKHGATVGGRCETEEAQAEYAELFRRQLTELLSGYGEMVEVWFDGSLIVDVSDIMAEYASRAIVFQGPHATIRWVGNEAGHAPYPAWNSVKTIHGSTGVATAANGDPDGAMWLPLECDARIRANWFWNSKNAATLKSVDELVEMYYLSVGRGANMLLNHTPDITGAIPEADAKRSAEFYAEVQRRFGRSLGETSGSGISVELDLGSPTTIDHVITMEDIAFGERVREYRIDGYAAGEWKELCRGSSIGHKRIDPLKPVSVSKVRFRTLESVSRPLIRKLAVYDTGGAYVSQDKQVSVWAAPKESGREITLWEWDESLATKWQTLRIDIRQYCDEAGQYLLTFREGCGAVKNLEVGSVVLAVDNQDAPEFVQAAAEVGQFRVNISGIDRNMELKIRLRRSGASIRSGELLFKSLATQ